MVEIGGSRGQDTYVPCLCQWIPVNFRQVRKDPSHCFLIGKMKGLVYTNVLPLDYAWPYEEDFTGHSAPMAVDFEPCAQDPEY